MFHSAKLKIERANHHINDLERQLGTFSWENLNRCSTCREPNKLDIIFVVAPIPPAFAMIIGDAVHNLRTALDHLMWEIVGPGHQHNQLYFPMGGDRLSYEGTCGGVKTPDPAINKLLKSLAVFPGGKGEDLYIVHRLDRADKHSVLTPVMNVPRLSDLILESGGVSRPLAELYGADALLREGETFTIHGASADSRLAFKDNANVAPNVAFGNVEFIKDQPIFPTIKRLSHAFTDTINVIEGAIS